MPVRTHQHLKCPRCHVSVGRADTICWACRHVLKAPVLPVKYVWLWRSAQVLAGAVVVILLIKYRVQLQFILQDSVRSLIKPR